MIDWLHNLPLGWMALAVFVVTYLVAAGIYWLVMALAVGERARAFKAISPGMLPPLESSSVCSWHSSPHRFGVISIGHTQR